MFRAASSTSALVKPLPCTVSSYTCSGRLPLDLNPWRKKSLSFRTSSLSDHWASSSQLATLSLPVLTVAAMPCASNRGLSFEPIRTGPSAVEVVFCAAIPTPVSAGPSVAVAVPASSPIFSLFSALRKASSRPVSPLFLRVCVGPEPNISPIVVIPSVDTAVSAAVAPST